MQKVIVPIHEIYELHAAWETLLKMSKEIKDETMRLRAEKIYIELYDFVQNLGYKSTV